MRQDNDLLIESAADVSDESIWDAKPESDAAFAAALNRYFSQAPKSVPQDAWWISIVFFYLLLPVNLLVSVVAIFLNPVFRWLASLVMFSTLHGRPLWMAWAWWWYQVAGALQLIVRSGASRFTLFSRSRQIFGNGAWWWHGEGAWNCPYESVRATMASNQKRSAAFGAVSTCVPELFPQDTLLFVDGAKWEKLRRVLVANLTEEAKWGPRVASLPSVLGALAEALGRRGQLVLDKEGGQVSLPLEQLTRAVVDQFVAAAIWYLLFGVKLSVEQAATVAQWGAGGLAGYFVFPRMIHRIAFNLLLRKVTKLRKDTLAVFRAQGLGALAADLNGQLGPHMRPSTLAYVDELMYAVNFAGVGGTQHGCWGTISFLQRKTIDVKPSAVRFDAFADMPALYAANPDAFIKECVRLDAPVTSATCAFGTPAEGAAHEPKTVTVEFNNSCCGGVSEHTLPEGTLHQYVLSIANRDPSKFGSPDHFDPSRSELDEMVGWNGALSAPHQYPRICPGQAMSLVVVKSIVGLIKEVQQACVAKATAESGSAKSSASDKMSASAKMKAAQQV